MRPFLGGKHPRDEIERDQSFSTCLIAIDIEGDAHATKDQIGFLALAGEKCGISRVQPFLDSAIRRAHMAIFSVCSKVIQRALTVHFIKEWKRCHGRHLETKLN
jgi:hypothetical protein